MRVIKQIIARMRALKRWNKLQADYRRKRDKLVAAHKNRSRLDAMHRQRVHAILQGKQNV